ncbi:rRNA maturation RNase YbeY [Candidatus Gracilibacteria bacterium]|nr:rRNA maturation RNase YbeY [Candidatus Gracilibacteria bacterium]
MFKYNILYKPSFQYNTKTIDNIFKIISKIVKKEQNGVLNIVFLDDNSIQKLNKDYRNIDKTTDVLSFHYFDDFKNLKKDDLAGEIILSENKIISQGKEYKLGTEKEFYKLIIHSILHILGYDHETDKDYKIMQNLENKVYKEVFEK